MTIYTPDKKPLASTSTIVTGVPFIFGPVELELRGYSIAAEEGELLRAHREGDTYLVADGGAEWHLYLVAFRGPRGLVVAPEPVRVNKEGSQE
jgi:hypothetical protein